MYKVEVAKKTSSYGGHFCDINYCQEIMREVKHKHQGTLRVLSFVENECACGIVVKYGFRILLDNLDACPILDDSDNSGIGLNNLSSGDSIKANAVLDTIAEVTANVTEEYCIP